MTHLKGLNEAQKRAVEHIDGPLLIVAGAGAGKTKTITHRMANAVCQGILPSRLLGVTFTNKAAGEMRERVRRLLAEGGIQRGEPMIATFHSLSVRLLREFGDTIGIPRSFVIWDRDDSLRSLKKILKDLGIEMEPRKVLGAISAAKSKGVGVDEYASSATSHNERIISQAWSRYDKDCKAHDALDFDDLLVKARSLLHVPSVLNVLHERWSHITIDEYQDTNTIQYDIARLLAGDSRNICAVGDLDQCIYTWRQARLENLLQFESSFPGTTVVTLEQNYRSTQTILTAANAIIEKNTHRLPKRLFTENGTGDAIVVAGLGDEVGEARFICERVRELLAGGTDPSEIAVLFRENFQSRAIEEMCIRTGIPYRVLGVRFFDRAEVKDVIAYLRASLNRKSRADVERAAGAPPRGIGKQTLDKLFDANATLSGAPLAKVQSFLSTLDRIRDSIETRSPTETILFVLKESGMEARLAEGDDEDRERLANVRELASLAVAYEALSPREGIERLLEEAALMSDQDTLQAKEDAISLMTVHASKGLEFDAVFVTGLEQGLFPSERDLEARDNEEERRLFYVAMTRAKKYLYLSYAHSRLRYGSREFTLPSEFLDDIDPRLTQVEQGHSRGGTQRRTGGILDWYEDENTIR